MDRPTVFVDWLSDAAGEEELDVCCVLLLRLSGPSGCTPGRRQLVSNVVDFIQKFFMDGTSYPAQIPERHAHGI